MVQYADDTQILLSGKKDSLPQLIATMEHLLESFDAWFHSHGLKVNTGKTELIVFGSRQNCRGLDPISIRFREDMIREGPTVRNLGVLFNKRTQNSHFIMESVLMVKYKYKYPNESKVVCTKFECHFWNHHLK